jgi:hypothetical protein
MISYGAPLRKIQKRFRPFFANKWMTQIPLQSMYSQVDSNANINSTLPSFSAAIGWPEGGGRKGNLQQQDEDSHYRQQTWEASNNQVDQTPSASCKTSVSGAFKPANR